MAARRRRLRGAGLTIVLAAALVCALVLAAFLLGTGSGPASGLAAYNLGAGLLTVSREQNVSGTSYWDAFCAAPEGQEFPYCVSPAGILFVPTQGVMVLTESVPGNDAGGGPNAIVEVDPTTNQNISELDLSCDPGIPFFPGSGVDVFVPCANSDFDNYSLLEFDVVTNEIVGNVSTPIWIDSMTYDSQNGLIYGGGRSNFWGTDVLLTFNPSSLASLSATKLESVTFLTGYPPNAYTVAYDPFTNRLLAPSNASYFTGGSVLALDPLTNTTAPVESSQLGVVSLTVYSQTDQVFASIFNLTAGVSLILVLNATTYTLEGQVSVPGCIGGLCSLPNEVTHVLIDPVHGDAYLVSAVGPITLNLSTLSIVGETAAAGDGPPASSAYYAPMDRIFGTYGFLPGPSPGFMVQMDHTTYGLVTSLFWLSVPLGTVLLASALGLAIGAVAFWILRRGSTRSSRPLSD